MNDNTRGTYITELTTKTYPNIQILFLYPYLGHSEMFRD